METVYLRMSGPPQPQPQFPFKVVLHHFPSTKCRVISYVMGGRCQLVGIIEVKEYGVWRLRFLGQMDFIGFLGKFRQ